MSKPRSVASYRSIRSRDKKIILAEAVRLMEMRTLTMRQVREQIRSFAKAQCNIIFGNRVANHFLSNIVSENVVKSDCRANAKEETRIAKGEAPQLGSIHSRRFAEKELNATTDESVTIGIARLLARSQLGEFFRGQPSQYDSMPRAAYG